MPFLHALASLKGPAVPFGHQYPGGHIPPYETFRKFNPSVVFPYKHRKNFHAIKYQNIKNNTFSSVSVSPSNV